MNNKSRPVFCIALDKDTAKMLFYDLFGDGKAKPCTMLLGRIKRCEDVIDIFAVLDRRRIVYFYHCYSLLILSKSSARETRRMAFELASIALFRTLIKACLRLL
jgi:hypothetical protein